MIKNILWDFDGVILDSMKIKGDGFVELFSYCTKEQTDSLFTYHFLHGGVSRFEKIRFFYKEILNKSIEEDQVLKLADRFGDIVTTKLSKQENLIQDSVKFIQNNYTKYNFHIVSGAEEKELQLICSELDLTKYFKSIQGSPTKKKVLVTTLLHTYNYKKSETILIGDAVTDYDAALNNGIVFFGYNNQELKSHNYIESFSGFQP